MLWGACRWVHIGRGAGQSLGHSACVATLQTLLDEVGGLLLIAAEDGRSNLCLQALEVEAQAAKVKAIQQAALVVGEATEALLQAAPACRVALLVSESRDGTSIISGSISSIAAQSGSIGGIWALSVKDASCPNGLRCLCPLRLTTFQSIV